MNLNAACTMLGRRIVEAAPALGQRNFRRYFFAQIGSVLGTFVQSVALSWLVYRLSGSAWLLGMTAFLSQAPQLFVSPLAGVLLDRFDRRRILIVLQGLFAVQALALVVLSGTGQVEVWQLVALAAGLGILNSFDLPARQSLLCYLVDDRATLANAVALNAAVVHAGRFVGPPLAGLLLASLPESVCFLLNAVSYLGPVLAVRAIRVDLPATVGLKAGAALHEAGCFISGRVAAWSTLLAVGLVNGTASSYIVLMPVFAREVFAGDARMLGGLLGMGGGGALLMALWLSSRRRPAQVTAVLPGAGLLAASGLAGFAMASWLGSVGLAMPALALLGAGIAATNIAGNTRLQYLAPEGLRGRVIAAFSSCRFGFDACGGLLAGALAARWGVLPVIGGQCVLLVLGSIWLGPHLRRANRPD